MLEHEQDRHADGPMERRDQTYFYSCIRGGNQPISQSTYS